MNNNYNNNKTSSSKRTHCFGMNTMCMYIEKKKKKHYNIHCPRSQFFSTLTFCVMSIRLVQKLKRQKKIFLFPSMLLLLLFGYIYREMILCCIGLDWVIILFELIGCVFVCIIFFVVSIDSNSTRENFKMTTIITTIALVNKKLGICPSRLDMQQSPPKNTQIIETYRFIIYTSCSNFVCFLHQIWF